MYPRQRLLWSGAASAASESHLTFANLPPGDLQIYSLITNMFADDDTFSGWGLTHTESIDGSISIVNMRFTTHLGAVLAAEQLISTICEFDYDKCGSFLRELSSTSGDQDYEATFITGDTQHTISIYRVDPDLI